MSILPQEADSTAATPGPGVVDGVVEGVRGWVETATGLGPDSQDNILYSLLAISVMLGRGSPFRNAIVNGHILDEEIMKNHWTRDYEPGWEPRL